MIKLVFCCTTGRSGTGGLAELLSRISGVRAVHEPEPKYQWESLKLQSPGYRADQFVETVKAPAIIAECVDAHIYVETSHLTHKGFAESWFELGFVPDLIILEREPELVARSLFSLGFDFHSDSSHVMRWLLHPEDRRFLHFPLADWKQFNNFQLCYWYCLEMRARSSYYETFYESRGARVITTSLSALRNRDELARLVSWCGGELNDALASELNKVLSVVHNTKLDQKIADRTAWLEHADIRKEVAPVLTRFHCR